MRSTGTTFAFAAACVAYLADLFAPWSRNCFGNAPDARSCVEISGWATTLGIVCALLTAAALAALVETRQGAFAVRVVGYAGVAVAGFTLARLVEDSRDRGGAILELAWGGWLGGSLALAIAVLALAVTRTHMQATRPEG